MDKGLKNINLGEVINLAVEGPYGPLAIAVIGIVAVFSIYMSYATDAPVNHELA